jgi:hypothetical protein
LSHFHFQACAGIIVVLFMGVVSDGRIFSPQPFPHQLALFALDIVTNKILSPQRRKYRYQPQM